MKVSLAVAATLVGSALAIDPIVINGSKFFYSSNNTQFFIRGVAYQQDYSSNGTISGTTSYKDPLADATACQRDVPILQELRTNTIRTYAIDPTADHKECMQLLAEAGIYVITDLSDPTDSINRNDPTWEVSLYQRYTSVIDEMAQYNNTIGFFAGNEVSNTVATTDASAFVKAAVRDMKAYIKRKDYRPMGVGYATADDSSIRVNMADYFNCDNSEDNIDFWGYNIYSWCGDSSYEASGYKDRTEEFQNYSVPVFFAEYGCNQVTPRLFTEVSALYGNTMAQVWSGGIVYMYFQEANNYGLVSVIDSTSVSKLADFTSYSNQIVSATPTGVNKASYTPTNTALQSCPAVSSATWLAEATPLPPTPNAQLCNCMGESAGCVVSNSVSPSDYSDLFGIVCGDISCDGIARNATTGKFGAYGMCNPQQQLNFVLNQYYTEKGSKASACSFSGSATQTATAKPTGTCGALLSQAGSAGTGTVTSQPTGTGSSGSATSTSSKGAAPVTVSMSVTVGSFQFGAYIVTAILAGIAMIAL